MNWTKDAMDFLDRMGQEKQHFFAVYLDYIRFQRAWFRCKKESRSGPQRFGMFHELKVKEMMYYFAAAKKVSKEKREAEIERVLADVNLSEKAEEKVGHLSGGMQRRLGIAQAILGDPDILFLDEPTTGLDPEERSHFKEIIRKLAKDDKIIVISTHIVQEVEAVCDRVLIMKDGTLLENVTVEEACHFAGDDNATLEQGYLQRLKEA